MRSLLIIVVSLISLMFHAQNIETMKYEQLEEKIASYKNQLVVVNFWATTCAPCVKELPYFNELNQKHSQDQHFKMILVSLDMSRDKQKVINFINKNSTTPEVIILDDNKRMNTWIPKFDKDWDGVIPVTFFYKNGEKLEFHNGEISREELDQKITKYLNL